MKTLGLLSISLLLWFPLWVNGQSSPLGWEGDTLIPPEQFYDAARWTANASAGNECSLYDTDSCLTINWKLQPGKGQWVQCFYVFDNPVSLSRFDIFGFDLHGSSCHEGNSCHKQHVLEIKFEDGTHQAIHTRMGEDGILGVDRWVENLFFHRYDNFFSVPEGFNWDSVRALSFGVKAHPWVNNPPADSGTVSFRVLIADSTAGWARAEQPENLSVPEIILAELKEGALDLILSRQQSAGLITTWTEEGLSWLYGQGLALKILSIEGVWDGYLPMNEAAEAAEKLAHFLADAIQSEGYWPRAWNSYTGEIVVLHEENGQIWMGDFPWILTGLSSYYKKSGDCYVADALLNGHIFLTSLIEEDGSFFTYNVLNQNTELVTSSEAYAAAIGALLELYDEERADLLISRIDADTWDEDLQYWKEGVYSDRVVLFTNTWLAELFYDKGYTEKAMDALTLCGKMMYTCGPGEPCGLDGIGPIAVWYEGVLSYIAAGGPGSNELFENIRPFINEDGSVPHYNDNIGGTAGIWAEPWASLDGTSWLYCVSTRSSPFDILEGPHYIHCFEGLPSGQTDIPDIKVYPSPFYTILNLSFPDLAEALDITIYDRYGREIFSSYLKDPATRSALDLHQLDKGVYLLRMQNKEYIFSRTIIKFP